MGGNEKIRPNIMVWRHIQMDFTLLKIKTNFIIYLYFRKLQVQVGHPHGKN